MKAPLISTREIVQVVIDSVGSEDLVRDIATQHDIFFILENGSDEAGPQLKSVCVCVCVCVCACMSRKYMHACL